MNNTAHGLIQKRDKFARLCGKLLMTILSMDNYPTIKMIIILFLGNRETIDAYFNLIDFELNHDDRNKIFFLKSSADRNRETQENGDGATNCTQKILLYQKQGKH